MSTEQLIHLGRLRRVRTFKRDDRNAVETVSSGLSDMLAMLEALLIQEKYGLSVTFCDDGGDELGWAATDPEGRYIKRGNTPAAAIFMWDCEREQYEEQSRPHAWLCLRSGSCLKSTTLSQKEGEGVQQPPQHQGT